MTYRRISDGLESFAAVKAPADLGPVPDQRWIPITNLVVDDGYQRPIVGNGRTNVRKIADQFSWSKFSPVVCSPVPGGLFAIIDGQHRTTAAALLGFESVPCQIVVASQSQQAEAFAAINGNTTAMGGLALFAARVASGDPDARALFDACAECGVTILRYPVGATFMKPGQTLATGALQRIWKGAGRDILVLTLKAIMDTANREKPGSLKATIIIAVAGVLEENAKWRDAGEALFDAFDEIDLVQELSDATAEAAKRGGGISAGALLRGKLLTHLDRRLG